MEIQIHDTWVKGKNGTMHFDVAIEQKEGNDNKIAVESAKKWLTSIGEKDATITSNECKFCHTQGASPKVEEEIKKDGYSIIKMDGCPK